MDYDGGLPKDLHGGGEVYALHIYHALISASGQRILQWAWAKSWPRLLGRGLSQRPSGYLVEAELNDCCVVYGERT